MPGNYCVVACCRNYFGKTKKYEATSSISYHKFPKDPNLRYLWIKACGKEGELIRNSSSVCSKHFKIEDFGDYEKTVLKKDGKIKCLKNKLKQGAVPTLYLKKEEKKQGSFPEGEIKFEFIKIKECDEEFEAESEETIIDIGETSYEQPEESLAEKICKLEKDNDLLKETINLLREENKNLSRNVEKQAKEIALLSKEKEKFILEKKIFEARLSKVFSKTQMDLVTKKKSKVIWSSDDISKAFDLRRISNRSYLFVRNTMKIPLPHVHTLQKWSAEKAKLKKNIS